MPYLANILRAVRSATPRRPDGAIPSSALIFDASGALYGTTSLCVGNRLGAGFSVNRETVEGTLTLLNTTVRVCTFLLRRVIISVSFRSIPDDLLIILIIALSGLAISLLALEHGWIDIATISW
jgi:hypothetical protein